MLDSNSTILLKHINIFIIINVILINDTQDVVDGHVRLALQFRGGGGVNSNEVKKQKCYVI